MTSIGFGKGEVIEVDLAFDRTRDLIQNALTKREFVQFQDDNGEIVIINPMQVTILQRSSAIPNTRSPSSRALSVERLSF